MNRYSTSLIRSKVFLDWSLCLADQTKACAAIHIGPSHGNISRKREFSGHSESQGCGLAMFLVHRRSVNRPAMAASKEIAAVSLIITRLLHQSVQIDLVTVFQSYCHAVLQSTTVRIVGDSLIYASSLLSPAHPCPFIIPESCPYHLRLSPLSQSAWPYSSQLIIMTGSKRVPTKGFLSVFLLYR